MAALAQDVRGGNELENIKVLRHTYLARGRSRREENALKKRVSSNCCVVLGSHVLVALWSDSSSFFSI